MKKTALITGIKGQDGSYLAELLLRKGYTVHGVTRSPSRFSENLGSIARSLQLHPFSRDASFWTTLVEELQPTELYHLAANSFVPSSWDDPVENLAVNTGVTTRILEAVRRHSPATRVLNACSREIFGIPSESVANEDTAMRPHTPYGIHKAAARWMVNSYCDRYGIFASNAILFNHESPRRPAEFVTRKITKHAAEIRLGITDCLELGNHHALRDWGFAGDFVDAMWRALQIDTPEDFVIGTGVVHSIADFASKAFARVDLNWEDHVVSNEKFSRQRDSLVLAADISKAEELLDWRPRVCLDELVSMMVDCDLAAYQQPQRRAA